MDQRVSRHEHLPGDDPGVECRSPGIDLDGDEILVFTRAFEPSALRA
jgi:hypothetical protein